MNFCYRLTPGSQAPPFLKLSLLLLDQSSKISTRSVSSNNKSPSITKQTKKLASDYSHIWLRLLKYIDNKRIYNTVLSRVNNLSILGMKKSSSSFQDSFFDYQIPTPMATVLPLDFVRNNDARLLIEIATKSSLRMFTDAKTGNLHFICKQRGSECFDIEAESHPLHYGYYFTYDYLKLRHQKNCELEKEAFEYLKIYNLMKIKKKLIEDYMIKLLIVKESPSVILFKLSNHSEVYFFEKYINGNIEFKRKLRKRFDNIVNIDIKKIGKSEQDCQKKEQKQQKLPPKMSKARKLKWLKNRQRTKLARIKIMSKHPDQQSHRVTATYQDINRTPNTSKTRSKSPILNIIQDESKDQNSRQEQPIFEQQQEDEPAQQQVLPEIMVLNEQAQYIWSESQLDSSVQNQLSEVQLITKDDYFKSLRNSALKQSLERQSLSFCLFSLESAKDNKQNQQ